MQQMAGAGVDRCFGIERAARHRRTVIYRRVSRHGQQADLESQRRMVERIVRDEIGTLIVAHRDRLCRFGSDWFEHLMAIVPTFSCRLSGLRRPRKQIREAAADGQGQLPQGLPY